MFFADTGAILSSGVVTVDCVDLLVGVAFTKPVQEVPLLARS